MVGWELCRGEANLREADINLVRGLNTPLATFTIDCNSVAMQANFTQSRELGIALPDPVAMAVALDRDGVVKHMSDHYVQVECSSDLTRGMTVIDQLGVTYDGRNQGVWSPVRKGEPNVWVVWAIDIARHHGLNTM